MDIVETKLNKIQRELEDLNLGGSNETDYPILLIARREMTKALKISARYKKQIKKSEAAVNAANDILSRFYNFKGLQSADVEADRNTDFQTIFRLS